MARLGRSRLVVSAVIYAENKVLLVRRAPHDSYPGMWEFPGGGVDDEIDDEKGESVVDALRREVLEETGIVLPIFPTGEVLVHPTRTALRVVLRFDLESIPGVTLSDEHDEGRFLSLEEAKVTIVGNDIVHDTMRRENQRVMNMIFDNNMGMDP